MFDDITTNQAPPPGNLPLEPEDIFSTVDESASSVEKQSLEESVAPAPVPPNALEAGMLKKKTAEALIPSTEQQPPSPQLQQPAVAYAVKGPVLGKVLLVFFGGVAMVGISIGAWWGYNTFFNPAATVPVKTITQNNSVPNVLNPAVVSSSVAQPIATTPPVPAATITPPATGDSSTNTLSAKMKNDQILFGETVDSDHDGIDDQHEKMLGTNPQLADTDADGLSDGEEAIVWKTDPLNPDTDGDGYPDGQEVHNNYNPLGSGKIVK